ncbi:MAG: hypothetical protein JJT89_12290 [Nitriliruptoraceae bacterium]|nr:hypothetical protein [Nitriliruptoraceae bacterium]
MSRPTTAPPRPADPSAAIPTARSRRSSSHGSSSEELIASVPAASVSSAPVSPAMQAARRGHPVAHASGSVRLVPVIVDGAAPDPRQPSSEDGSLVTEYGLLAVVAATIAGVVITWSSGGALVTLFNALLRQARALVGA